MARNPGSVVDVGARTVRDRDGRVHAAKELAVTEHGLYYHRPIDGFDVFFHQERWILPAHGWVINRFAFYPQRTDKIDWYIETDLIEIAGDEWRVADGYLDVLVHEGLRYDVDDADELAEGMQAGEITVGEATAVLLSFGRLCRELMANGCSGVELLSRLAPTLPRSMIVRGEDGEFVVNASTG